MTKRSIFGILSLAILAASCDSCDKEPEIGPGDPAPNLQIKFRYDYNILWNDTFSEQVTSVNVWAFGSDGSLVWSGAADSDDVKSPEFRMIPILPEGKYDVIAWCGLKDNSAFNLATYTPTSKEELEVTLNTIRQGDLTCSDSNLAPIHYASTTGINVPAPTQTGEAVSVTLSLISDTKDIHVWLRNIDGTPVDTGDYTVTLTFPDNGYAWDNTLLSSSAVIYRPYGVRISDNALVHDFSTLRMTTSTEAFVSVTRNSDGNTVVRLPLVQYLLMAKEQFGNIMDQEYLNRQNYFSLGLLMDSDGKWYQKQVYVNEWSYRLMDGEEL